jgi:hypothetical protein
LMIMPGRICVAGIAIKEKLLHLSLDWLMQNSQQSIVAPSLLAEDSGEEAADAVEDAVVVR